MKRHLFMLAGTVYIALLTLVVMSVIDYGPWWLDLLAIVFGVWTVMLTDNRWQPRST